MLKITEKSLEMVGTPEELCMEMALAIENFSAKILAVSDDPLHDARQMSVLFTTAITESLEREQEARR